MLKQIQNEYDILQHFKEIEDKSWKDDPPDKEDPTRVFIDGLINIISKIRYPPKGIGKKDAEKEVENANELVEKVEELTKEKIISEDSSKTTAEIVEGRNGRETKGPTAETVVETRDSAQFKIFLCCLLMADFYPLPKGDVFSGVFKVKLRFMKSI
jgi:hypothetical protein